MINTCFSFDSLHYDQIMLFKVSMWWFAFVYECTLFDLWKWMVKIFFNPIISSQKLYFLYIKFLKLQAIILIKYDSETLVCKQLWFWNMNCIPPLCKNQICQVYYSWYCMVKPTSYLYRVPFVNSSSLFCPLVCQHFQYFFWRGLGELVSAFYSSSEVALQGLGFISMPVLYILLPYFVSSLYQKPGESVLPLVDSICISHNVVLGLAQNIDNFTLLPEIWKLRHRNKSKIQKKRSYVHKREAM